LSGKGEEKKTVEKNTRKKLGGGNTRNGQESDARGIFVHLTKE